MPRSSKIKANASGSLTSKFDGKAKQNRNLKECKCLILVSIKDKDECTGDHFAATAHHSVETYANTTFLMVDEAYWHNLKVDSQEDEKTLRQKAISLGDEWFLKNEKTFLSMLILPEEELNFYNTMSVDSKIAFLNTHASNSKLNFKIIRWTDWLKLENNPKNLAKIFNSMPSLSEGIHDTARDYANRHAKKEKDKYNKFYQASKDYLIEECYPVMHIGAVTGHDFIAYPGGISRAMKETWHHFVEFQFPNKMNWLHINFKKIAKNVVPVVEDILKQNVLSPAQLAINSLTENRHFFFAINDLKQKISKFPESRREELLSLSLAFLYLLQTKNSVQDETTYSQIINTFNSYTDLLIKLADQNLADAKTCGLEHMAKEQRDESLRFKI